MRNGVTTASATAMAAGLVNMALLVQITFLSETVYIYSGVGNVLWNGNTWYGVGSLGSIATIEETVEVRATGVALKLSGIDPQLLAESMNDYRQGLPVLIWLMMFDGVGAIIPNPILSFQGKTDVAKISVDGQTATISINAETRLIDMNTSVVRRWTPCDQALINPLDQGLNWVPSIAQIPLFWGQSAPTGQSSGSSN